MILAGRAYKALLLAKGSIENITMNYGYELVMPPDKALQSALKDQDTALYFENYAGSKTILTKGSLLVKEAGFHRKRISLYGARGDSSYFLGRLQFNPNSVASQKSITGRRKSNEDSASIGSVALGDKKYSFYIVADGAGGLGGGDVASSTAVAVAATSLIYNISRYDAKQAIFEALRKASSIVGGIIKKSGRKIASTLSVALLDWDAGRIHYANVGDSPILLADGEGVRLLSKIQHVEIGEGKTALTSYIGGKMSIYYGDSKVAGPATLLLMSDGAYQFLDEEEILEATKRGDVVSITELLVKRAYQNGSDDNITVVAAKVGEGIVNCTG